MIKKGFISFVSKYSAARFALVGTINTAVGSTVMFLMYNVFGASYWLSSASNYIIGSIVSYFLNKHYTFKVKDRSIREIIAFIVNIIACYFVAYDLAYRISIFVFSMYGRVAYDNIAMGIGMILFTILNYLGQRFLVFRYKPLKIKEDSKNDTNTTH